MDWGKISEMIRKIIPQMKNQLGEKVEITLFSFKIGGNTIINIPAPPKLERELLQKTELSDEAIDKIATRAIEKMKADPTRYQDVPTEMLLTNVASDTVSSVYEVVGNIRATLPMIQAELKAHTE